ncbi:MAG: DUF952 domain-containing protein [Rubricella sp.]
MLIYKIFRAPEWATLEARGETAGAPVDIADGFIHFSTAETVRETAAKHFGGEDGLILAACDAAAFGEDLKWEVSRGGALFPHLYRSLRLEEIIRTWPLPVGADGHRFPELAQ